MAEIPFHYTDLRNAVAILRDGCLYCRGQAEQSGRLLVSSGSSTVLAGTADDIKACVRLYFRPQTPTQYHAEGIRSSSSLASSRYPDAHCPVPVFLLFDLAALLTRADCRFSDGGLNSAHARRMATSQELRDLPWKKIYHNGPFDPHSAEESDIGFRRNAEVTVPGCLDLTILRYVYCRSVAEKETLLHLLPPELRGKYEPITAATTSSILFFRKHTFIESATLSSTKLLFRFSPDTLSPGPFRARSEIVPPGGQRLRYQEDSFSAKGTLRLSLRAPVSQYSVSLYLDDNLAYSNSYRETDSLF